jgi:homoserine dehydrogenase
MTQYKLAFIGFGNVGQALARLLERKRTELAARYDLSFLSVAIITGRHGAAIDPQGLDIQRALKIIANDDNLNELSTRATPKSMLDFIHASQADVLFENTPVNYENGQPAVGHLQAALELGMHAITANKGPVVHAYQQLTQLAASKGKRFLFESTVMDGAPIFSLFRSALPAAQLLSFQGIFNSTTNLILTRMETGESFAEAVAYAQSIGIAETDPSGDIDGWDAAIKVAALVNVLMGVAVKPAQVTREGIRHITSEQVRRSLAQGKRYKLVCSARRTPQGVQAQVAPELVGADSPMYNVMGTTSIAQFETDVLGQLSLIEADPGPHTTAYGLLADFVNAVQPI